MYWANFLHIYQPPCQTRTILNRVAEESYQKIVEGLLNHPEIKLTLNINAGLTEMLAEYGWEKIIFGLKKLLERGQIEITGSAKYHPLLPKLPPVEIERQIEINTITNRQFFGPAYQPKGFFPPEMAFSPKIGKMVQKLGFSWIILDETALAQKPDYSVIYKDKSGMIYFFRERKTSFKILSAQLGTADILKESLTPRLDKNEYLLTAMDGETFGHHRPGLEQLLWDIGNLSQIQTITLSSLLQLFKNQVVIAPLASSWAFTNKKTGNFPFQRWDDQDNEIHQKQWELTRLAIDLVEKDNRPQSRNLLDKALFSDQYWWASAKPWWSLETIEKGAFALLKAVKSCRNTEERAKIWAEELYAKIVATSIEWQRSGKVEKFSRKEDEEIREWLTNESASLSEQDYSQMVDNLTKQMLKAGSDQEYVRAEQIKARIQELKEKKSNIKVNQ